MQNFDLYYFSLSGHSYKNKTRQKFNGQKFLPAKISQSTVAPNFWDTNFEPVVDLKHFTESIIVAIACTHAHSLHCVKKNCMLNAPHWRPNHKIYAP